MIRVGSLPRDHVPEVRRALSDVAKVCAALGIERSRTEHGKWVCPRHNGGSMHVRLGRDRTIQVKCFGCNLSGDVFSLIAEVHGYDTEHQFPKVLAIGARIGGLWGILDELEGRTAEERGVSPPMPAARTNRANGATGSPARHELTTTSAAVESVRAAEQVEVRLPERPFPPAEEVRALWAACVPVSAVPAVQGMLDSRELKPDTIELYGLARAIPDGCPLPRWASYRGQASAARSWLELGYRLLLPVYDAEGVWRSVRAWRVVEGDGPKRLPPAGFRAKGLVMADGAGQALLRAAAWHAGHDRRVVIVEGEPDFLTWATQFPDSAESVPAVLGVLSGSWSADIAARIPDGAKVIVRTHHDKAGDTYASIIAATLVGRCTVRRTKEPQ